MNNQEAFEKVFETFIVNKAPKSIRVEDDKTQSCTYGEPGTIGCAIACLLTPEERILAWDFEKSYNALPTESKYTMGTAVESLLAHKEIPSLRDVDLYLLGDLQKWHDDDLGDSDERANLLDVALKHGVQVYPILAKYPNV